MEIKKNPRNCNLSFRCTDEQKEQILKNAAALNMPYSTYICDKVLKGKERNNYARRKMVTTLITTSSYLDQICNLIDADDSETIDKNKLVPIIEYAREEYAKLWKY